MDAQAPKFPSYVAYLPLDDRHVVPIVDLDPESIKAGVEQIIKNPDKPIAHAAALSAVAKLLGIKGGIDGYKKEWSRVSRFMKDNGLFHRKDLIGRREDAGVSLYLNRGSVAQRVFASGLPLPGKLFTGHNFDWSPYNFWETKHLFFGGLNHGLKLIEEHPELIRPFLGFHFAEYISAVFNLLGDGLVHPRRNGSLVTKAYYEDTYRKENPDKIAANLQASSELFNMLRKQLDSTDAGWVDVVPFNDSLVFLRGKRRTVTSTSCSATSAPTFPPTCRSPVT